MSNFDPYHKWLAIPPDQQPPHHYRLLGLVPFEDDLDVIESSADRQMTHVRSFQTGKHSNFSQQLLNEIAAAKVELVSPARKIAYDKQLKAQLKKAAPQPVAKRITNTPVPSAPTPSSSPAGPVIRPERPSQRSRKKSNLPMVMMACGGMLLFAIVGISVMILSSEPADTPVVDTKEPTPSRSIVPPDSESARLVAPPISVPKKQPREDIQQDPEPVAPPVVETAKLEPAGLDALVDRLAKASSSGTLEGLVAHWKFEEGQGDVVHDMVGGIDGAIQGGATWTQGVHGKGLHFDGSNDWISFGKTIDLTNTEYTVGVWFKSDAQENEGALFALGKNTNNGLLLEIKRDGRVRYLHREPMGQLGGTRLFSQKARNDGQWHHLAAVKTVDEASLYVDGKQVATASSKRFFRVPTVITMGRLGPAQDIRNFRGNFDDVRVYNRALSPQEVLEISKASR